MNPRPFVLAIELTRSGDPFSLQLGEQEYSLRREDGSYGRATFLWSQTVLDDLARLMSPWPDRLTAQRLGRLLRSFLSPMGWGLQEAQLKRALAEGREVHVVFRFASAELYSLPWELLTLECSGQHLGELPGCFTRYEWPGTPATAPRHCPPPEGGRILFAWSSAGGPIPADAHLRALKQVCARSGHPFDERRDVLANVSLGRLEQVLAETTEPIGALHVLCHGSRASSETYGLLWSASRAGGEPELIDAGVLRQLLAPHADSIRMVVLCACQSGDAGAPANPLGSVAQAIHRVGLPAVIASRLPLSAEGSVRLTEALYGALLEGNASLQHALGEARSRLRQDVLHLDWASLQLYARAEDGPDLRPFIVRPYQGLLPFQPEHRRFFFGREALQTLLLRRVHDALEGKLPRFQVVAGASGSGKSSLVMAGLVPSLPDETWDALRVRPGEGGDDAAGPLALLARRLRSTWSDTAVSESSVTPESIVEEARALRHARGGRRVLLVIDQMEEILTCVNAAERQDLVRALWRLSQTPELALIVLITLRVDAFERCGDILLEDGGLRLDAVVYDDAHRLFVPQLQPDQYEAVIEGPARQVGLDFEEGLADLLKRDVGQEPGALPLLEYALDLLWQRRAGSRLTHQAYREIGGVVGALVQAANNLYDGLSEHEQRHARRLLVDLVDFRDEAAAFTRRRVWLEHVQLSGQARASFDAVLEKLVASRLVVRGDAARAPGVPGGAWVEVAHESLIRRWERLREWIQADRERVLQIRELQAWASAWRAHRGDPDSGASYLLTGIRLGYARNIQQKYTGELADDCNDIVIESWKRSERLAAIARRQREWLQDFAKLSVADKLRHEDPTTALLILREIKRPDRDLTWTQAVLDILQRPVSRALLRGHRGPLHAIAFSPNGTRVLTASKDRTAQLWPADGRGQPIALEGHTDALLSAAFSPNSSWVVTTSEDRTARVWGVDGGEEALVLEGHSDAVVAAAFDARSTRVVTASRDGTARVWRLATPAAPVVLQGHTRDVDAVAFSPDGACVVTASKDRTARVWKADGLAEPIVLQGHASYVRTACFSPDGTWVVTASDDGTARVWRADGQGEPLVLLGHTGGLNSALFSPNGALVVTASKDRTARVWKAHSSGEPLVLEGHEDDVKAATFSPSGTHVVTASYDRTARIWPSDGGGKPLVLKGHTHPVRAAVFCRDGRQVLTGSDDGTARVWQLDSGSTCAVLDGHSGGVNSAAFSPSGMSIVSASRDRTARIWHIDGAGEPKVLRGHVAGVNTAVFSPDGTRIVTASDDGTARVWRASEDLPPLTLEGHVGRVRAASFSPDGTRVATASWDGMSRIWRVDAPGEPVVLKGHTDSIRTVAFAADGARVVTASDDGTARVWPANEGAKPIVLEGHQGQVRTAVFSPDGDLVLTASDDGSARLWRIDGSGKPVVLRGHTGRIRTAAFSLDGARIVTGSDDGTTHVWQTRGEGNSVLLLGHTRGITAALFSPDGGRVLTASEDGSARVWRADGRGEPVTLQGHAGMITAATFSPDGTRVITSSADGTVRVWTLGIERLAQRLHQATTAVLGPQQRQQYLGEDPGASEGAEDG